MQESGTQTEEVIAALGSATGQINFYKFKIKLVHRWY